VHGKVMLGARTIGVWGGNKYEGECWSSGTIYRGRAGHGRGARGNQRSPSMAAFNSRVTGAEENGSTPFTRGEMEGRLRGAQSYAEEVAGGSQRHSGRRLRQSKVAAVAARRRWRKATTGWAARLRSHPGWCKAFGPGGCSAPRWAKRSEK
jgi:hypothetical protein